MGSSPEDRSGSVKRSRRPPHVQEARTSSRVEDDALPVGKRKGIHMGNGLERRGLLGSGAATLATLGLRPVMTEGKKKRKRKKGQGSKGGCAGCFRTLGAGEEEIFSVPGGTEETGISLCPEGTRAVSGSLFMGNPGCIVVEFSPTNESFTGWQLTIRCPAGQDSDANAVVATCIS